jgi:Fic family protein
MKKIGNAERLMAQMGELITTKIRPDEFTSEDFYEKYKMHPRTARDFLSKQVKKGILKMRKISHNGKPANAYSDAAGKA